MKKREAELLYMMVSSDTGTKQKIDCLLGIENQEQKREKLAEILKDNIFKKTNEEEEDMDDEDREPETLHLSNSYGFGNSERPFIGKSSFPFVS